MITLNSELDNFDKTGNSTHARWIANRLLSARKSGVISEVELAVFDTALSDDFGKYEAYQAGLNQQSNNSTDIFDNLIKDTFCKFSFLRPKSDGKSIPSVEIAKFFARDEGAEFKPVPSKVAEAISRYQAECFSSPTRREEIVCDFSVSIDSKGSNQQSDNLTIVEQVNDAMDGRKIEPRKRGEYPSHHFPHHQSW